MWADYWCCICFSDSSTTHLSSRVSSWQPTAFCQPSQRWSSTAFGWWSQRWSSTAFGWWSQGLSCFPLGVGWWILVLVWTATSGPLIGWRQVPALVWEATPAWTWGGNYRWRWFLSYQYQSLQEEEEAEARVSSPVRTEEARWSLQVNILHVQWTMDPFAILTHTYGLDEE